MTIGAISNKPFSFETERAARDQGFSLDLGKAAAAGPEARIASVPEEGDRADMEAYCTNT